MTSTFQRDYGKMCGSVEHWGKALWPRDLGTRLRITAQ